MELVLSGNVTCQITPFFRVQNKNSRGNCTKKIKTKNKIDQGVYVSL